MGSPDDLLIARLRERIGDPYRAADTDGLRVTHPGAYPPAPEQFVERAEKQLGFSLPPLLRRIYLEVGDGALGPGSGITGVGPAWGDSTSSLVEEYRGRLLGRGVEVEDWLLQMELTYDLEAAAVRAGGRWPERLLPVASSAGVTHCLDCATIDAPVVDFSERRWRRGAAWESLFSHAAPSLAAWLEAWLDGRLVTPEPDPPVRG